MSKLEKQNGEAKREDVCTWAARSSQDFEAQTEDNSSGPYLASKLILFPNRRYAKAYACMEGLSPRTPPHAPGEGHARDLKTIFGNRIPE